MKQYLVPFIVYVFSSPLAKALGADDTWAYAIKVAATLIAVLAYRKHYQFDYRLDPFAVFIGIMIFLFWIVLDGAYPPAFASGFVPDSVFAMLLRALGAVLLVPIVEEFFVRGFLMRYLIDPYRWEKVRMGTFTLVSFVFTILFFGLSHAQWLPGLVAGFLLNLVWYLRKDMNGVINAHAAANLCLAAYVIATGSWMFW
ncbi:CAAX prenyl protease-related protein [Candidatus Woesearchaeota archaeon]|nr:CAAX prenyl protease-related protein [Candidatus Woesearchaeota archaeon]